MLICIFKKASKDIHSVDPSFPLDKLDLLKDYLALKAKEAKEAEEAKEASESESSFLVGYVSAHETPPTSPSQMPANKASFTAPASGP